eukprot:2116687-Pyramimonas_sp.AAC.1
MKVYSPFPTCRWIAPSVYSPSPLACAPQGGVGDAGALHVLELHADVVLDVRVLVGARVGVLDALAGVAQREG